MKKVTAVVIGAGDRGLNAYAPYALDNPSKFQIVGVVEQNDARRKKFQQKYSVPDECCFTNYEDFFNTPKFADAVIITTNDKYHYEPCVRAIEQKYHILLEKPIADTPPKCLHLEEFAQNYDRVFMICYVLRYSAFYEKIKQLVTQGKIGRLVSIQEREQIGYMLYANSFVRGNWRKPEISGPIVSTKTCHDLDIFCWLAESRCKSIQSFGSLTYFKAENAPEGSPEYCAEGCPVQSECPYDAVSIYTSSHVDFTANALTDFNDSLEAKMEALKTKLYGRCVFKCDNSVPDNQIVNIIFENGITASMTIEGHAEECNRRINLYGTKAELYGDLLNGKIVIKDYLTGSTEKYTVSTKIGSGRHSGSDPRLAEDFVKCCAGDPRGKCYTNAAGAGESHMMGYAAEISRLENRVVDIMELRKAYKTGK